MKKLMLNNLKIESFITDREHIKGGLLATHSSDTGPFDCMTGHGPCPSINDKGC